MSRRAWIIVLIALGVAAAIVLGLLGQKNSTPSQAQAQQTFCSSLSTLDSSVKALTSLDPSTASKSDYQSAVDTIQSDWDQTKSDASDLKNITTTDLDNAWNSFKSSVDNVPSDASVSDALGSVKSSADTFATTVQSTLTGPDCSTSS